MTHDYKRNGTTTLFAALNVLDGKVIGECTRRHRHQEFLRFLRRVDRDTPAELDVHFIVDNYSTHTPCGPAMAEEKPTLPHALHPDFLFVAEPGGALVS